MPDDKLGKIIADPDFQSLGMDDQQKFLTKFDPDFGQLDTGQFTTFMARYKGQKSQPTQFEQQRSPAQQTGVVGGLKASLPSMPTSITDALQMAIEGPAGMIGRGLAGAVTNAPANIKAGAQSAMDATPQMAGHPVLNAINKVPSALIGGTAGALSPLAGVDPVAMRQAADRADTANVATQAAIPTAITLATAGAGKLPSMARAGAELNAVRDVAGSQPLNVAEAGKEALRMKDLQATGGRLPKVVGDFLNRATAPGKGAITFAEGRDFYTQATKLTTDEIGRLSGPMKYQMKQFVQELGNALNEAADNANQLDRYSGAVKEFSQAASNAQKMQRVKQVLKVIGTGALGGASAKYGYDLYQALTAK